MIPPLPLPDERPLTLLHEDKHIRLITEVLIALGSIPPGMLVVALLRGGDYAPDGPMILTTAISLIPLVFFASLRTPATYLLTTHRIAELHEGRLLWSLRYDQITRIRRIGGSLHLRGTGRTTYSVNNQAYVYWLENHLYDRNRS